MAIWPPTLGDFKADKFTDVTNREDDRDDAALQQCLDAAVAYVEANKWDMDFSFDELDTRPKPTVLTVLGTLRQAGRWFTRRNSPEGFVSLGELGSARVPAFDADIERMLGIGRYAPPVIA